MSSASTAPLDTSRLEGGFIRILGWLVFVGVLLGGVVPASMTMDAAPYSDRATVFILTWLPYAGTSVAGLVLVALGRIVQLLAHAATGERTTLEFEEESAKQEPSFRTSGLIAKR